AAFYYVANRIVDVEADYLDRGGAAAGGGDPGWVNGRCGAAGVTAPGYNIQANIGFADSDEAGGFLVAFKQTFLQQIVVHAHDADLEIAEAAAQLGDSALESKTENEQPICIAFVATSLNRFGNGLFADG